MKTHTLALIKGVKSTDRGSEAIGRPLNDHQSRHLSTLPSHTDKLLNVVSLPLPYAVTTLLAVIIFTEYVTAHTFTYINRAPSCRLSFLLDP